jgi:hypothetical protein
MNKLEKKIKRKKWAEKKTDNIRLKKNLLKEIVILEHYKEALYGDY